MAFLMWMLLGALVGETLASGAGLHGLTLLGRRWLPLTLPLLLASAYLCVVGASMPAWLVVLALLAGLALCTALAAWRRRALDPELLLAEDASDDYRVRSVGIPIEGGPLPAVLVEPAAKTTIAVLVLHGAGDHKTHFTWPLLHSLADAGLAACAIDVDGHGANPRTLDLPDVLENVAAGVEWLRERYARVAVLGISQGGAIAARAVAEGLAVDALALLETPISVAVTRAVVRSESRIVLHPAAWALHREAGTVGLARHWKTPPVRTRVGTVDLIRRLDLLGSVPQLRCPLLLVYGGADAVVPVAQAHQVAAVAPAGTTFVVVPRATHLSLSIDRRVARRVGAWLRDTLR